MTWTKKDLFNYMVAHGDKSSRVNLKLKSEYSRVKRIYKGQNLSKRQASEIINTIYSR
jgi:hypothetical protein